jgi:hypothetical protein
MAGDPIVYCLTRDPELARAVDERLAGAIAFFYNDAARLDQAITLRAPDHVIVDTGAVRAEYGDQGLGPVLDAVRRRAAAARLAVKPAAGAERLVAAEAGTDVDLLPADLVGCVAAVAATCGRA